MTEWDVGDLSFARWVEDLEAIVGATNTKGPFALLGISQGTGTCLAYVVRHPERVSRLVLVLMLLVEPRGIEPLTS